MIFERHANLKYKYGKKIEEYIRNIHSLLKMIRIENIRFTIDLYTKRAYFLISRESYCEWERLKR